MKLRVLAPQLNPLVENVMRVPIRVEETTAGKDIELSARRFMAVAIEDHAEDHDKVMHRLAEAVSDLLAVKR